MTSFLILRLSALGDVIHTLPAVEALRLAYPSATITWIVERPYADLVRIASPVTRVITVATRRWRRSPFAAQTRAEVSDTLRSLRSMGSATTVIDFQGLAKSAVLGRVTGRKKQLTFGRGAVRERIALLLATDGVDVDTSVHVVEQNLQLVEAVGADPTAGTMNGLESFADDSSGLCEYLGVSERLVINPGAGRPEKLWGTDRFAELCRTLMQRGYARPLIVWGPGEEEMAEAIALRGGGEKAPPTSLREMTAVLRAAPLLVSGDTGPLHVAAGLGTRVVALFGPTSPLRNGPWGQLDHCVTTWQSTKSMRDIRVDQVVQMVGRVWR